MSIAWPELYFPPINLWNYPMNDKVSVTTKSGDKGMTDGPDGTRITKTDPFIALVGALDEVNAQLGIAAAAVEFEQMVMLANCTNHMRDYINHQRGATQWIPVIQSKLLSMGAELYTGNYYIGEDDVNQLEKLIAEYEQNPGGFIIPRSDASSKLHLAKAMVRRAEREGVAIHNPTTFVSSEIVRYLNRLSDFLYVLALMMDDKPHDLWINDPK